MCKLPLALGGGMTMEYGLPVPVGSNAPLVSHMA